MAKAPIGFAFGGGGWLTTWYFGVLQGLIASGAFQPGVTPISGVSTGAQTAALGCSGGAPAAALHTALLGAAICLNTTTSPPCSGILDSVLRTEVNATLAPGAAARCGNTLTLGFSVPRAKRGVGGYGEPRLQARGNFRVTGFTSDEELIDGVSASGFMGCMSEPRPHTTFRGRPALAGGYTLTAVCPPKVKRCIKVHSGVFGKLFNGASGSALSGAGPSGDASGGSGGEGGSGSSSSGGGGGGGGPGRRLLAVPLPTTCPTTLGRPGVTFAKNPDIDIHPGKYNPVRETWWTWQSWAVDRPNIEGLKYAYELGVADGTSWAKDAGFAA